MNIAIILAGGVGARVGAKIPKQFIEVLGKPIMAYTLETFQNEALIDDIVLVCVSDYLEQARAICEKYGITKVSRLVPGGHDFFHSCLNGLNAIRPHCSDDDIVLVTSADRPFISPEEIADSVAVCEQHGSGIGAMKCARCMFMVGEDRSHSREYLRESLVQTATPWSFRYKPLVDAMALYEEGKLPGCEAYPLAVYAAAGHEVYFSKADPNNIKITEKTDIGLMEQMLLQKTVEE